MGQKYATIEVRQKMQQRLNDIEAAKSNPTAYSAIQDKQEFLSNEKRLKDTLSQVTPPDITGKEQDVYRSRLRMLQEALVLGKEGVVIPMVSHRRMWDNAPNTAGDLIRWGNYWKNHTLDSEGKVIKSERGKGALWECKDLMRTVNKAAEGEDPDIASLESIRPRDDSDPLSEVKRRSYGFSTQFKENYDEAFPEHQKTDVEQKVEKAADEQVAILMKRIAELEAAQAAGSDRQQKKDAARQASSERMKARWAAKKAQQQQPQIGE